MGADQVQHLEFTRDVATSFHSSYCPVNKVFPLPETLLCKLLLPPARPTLR